MTWKETDTDMKYRRLTGVMVSVAFLGLLTGCAGKESTEQRYAYPLGTASPEDTVTQIYAEKFAEEADRLSDGRISQLWQYLQVYFYFPLRKLPRPASRHLSPTA